MKKCVLFYSYLVYCTCNEHLIGENNTYLLFRMMKELFYLKIYKNISISFIFSLSGINLNMTSIVSPTKSDLFTLDLFTAGHCGNGISIIFLISFQNSVLLTKT